MGEGAKQNFITNSSDRKIIKTSLKHYAIEQLNIERLSNSELKKKIALPSERQKTVISFTVME